MGGDFAPDATTKGAVLARKELPKEIELVLIGDRDQMVPIIESEGGSVSDFTIVDTKDVIGMAEHPTRAFTQKPNSSIGIGFQMLKEKSLDSFASAGNTGAMLVGSMYTVKTIPGVIRPCITSIVPKVNGGMGVLLDVGTNADCKPDVLYQFGILGNLFARHVYNIESPKIGLLNIGEEPEKGNLVSQAAHGLMKDSKDFNFVGNVEGRDLLTDLADVIVCDGFTGNVVLKVCEGFFKLLKMRQRSDEYFDRFNYETYGGTPILGVNANVIIGHGISNAKAIKNMVMLSREVVNARLPEKIQLAFQ
jgi:glycerol-3-phosphate acyltransferase PlsX